MWNIDKQSMLKNFSTNDEKLLFSKVLDQLTECIKHNTPTFTQFLDPVRVENYIRIIQQNRDLAVQLHAYGKSALNERKIIGFFPDNTDIETDIFPISAIEISFNSKFNKKLTHRDFLGSVLGLGLDRGKIGDIVLHPPLVTCYVYSDIASYICTNLTKVSNTTVKTNMVNELTSDEFFCETIGDIMKVTLSSLRLDCFVSTIFKLSRSQSKEMIEKEKVFINWQVATNISKQVSENDLITVRGYGRAKFMEILGVSKKDKTIILLERTK